MTLATTITRNVWARNSALVNLALVGMGSLLIALLAQVRIMLPFTPVPVTGQTLGVLLIAAALGSRLGAATVALYIAEGALGLPFFAGGGSGVAYILGPTGGYLAGFVAAAFVVGALAEKGFDRRWFTALPAFLAGQGIIYLLGVSWLALYVGWERSLAAGLVPFVLGDAIKALAAALALPSAWALVRAWQGKSADQ
jgi:biotin transport system substrate-specific component